MKGPKEIVAESLANALADFFVVDPTMVETNLIRNAGITLKHVQLKEMKLPINNATCAAINGTVEQVSFSWSWGGDTKGSDWVKDARLTIVGLNFAAKLSAEALVVPTKKKGDERAKQHEAEDLRPKKGVSAYIEDQVQHILEALTLSIQDFELRIELPSNDALVVGGTAVELISLGRDKHGQSLHQSVSLGSLYSHIVVHDATFPLLERLAYTATCTRMFGKRFAGLDTGLQVVGASNDGGIVVHVGATQIAFMNELGGMILTSGTHEEEATTTTTNKPEEQTKHPPSDGASTFDLPLSAVSIVLPNGTKISLSGIMIKYKFDGTMLQIEGREGFFVDAFSVLSLGETSLWCADVVRSKLTLSDPACINPEAMDVVAFLHLRPLEMQTVMDGIDQAIVIYTSSKDSGALGVLASSIDGESSIKEDDDTVPWSVSIIGALALLWESGDDDNAEAVLRDVVVDTGSITTMRIQTMEKIYVPGRARLLQPLEDSVLTFNGSTAHLALHEIEAELLISEERPSKEEGMLEMNAEESKPFSLPIGLQLTFEVLRLKKPDGNIFATFTGLALTLHPEPQDGVDSVDIAVAVHLDDVQHDMIRLISPNLACVIHTDNLDMIDTFSLAANSITVATGYSMKDWSRLIGRGKDKIPQKKVRSSVRKSDPQSQAFQLPFAVVDELKLKFAVNGVVGMKESTQHIGAFKGKATTTSDDLIAYYTTRVLSNTPGLISNTEVLGVTVGDTAVGHYGSVFGATLLSGLGKAAGPAGGILSVAGFDGVRNAIKAGKQSRGAADDDKWRASDLVSGLAYAARQATRGGAAKRGKAADQRGDIVDWTLGATSDVVEYAGENKSRLGAAGAGTFGFILGTAVAGPFGGVAGAVLVSAVTGKTITTLESFGKNDSKPIRSHTNLAGAESFEYSVEDHERNRHATEEREELEINVVHHPPLRGVLAKRRDFFTWDWRTHFFMLEDSELKYYLISDTPTIATGDSSPGLASGAPPSVFIDDSKGPKKTLQLQGLSVEIDEVASKPKENLFVFTINIPGKNEPLWFLGAPTESYRATWVAELKNGCRERTPKKPAQSDAPPIFDDHGSSVSGFNAQSDAPPKPEHRSNGSACTSVEGEELEIEVASHPPPLRGVLAKRRDFFKWDWRTHFFALEGSELKYYLISDKSAIQGECSQEESAIYVDDSNGPQKALSLQGLSCEVDEAASKPEQNLYVFTIKEPGKKEPLWVLGAPSESYRTKWIVGLQRGMR